MIEKSKITRRSLMALIAAGTVAGYATAMPSIGVAVSNTVVATTAVNVRQAPNDSARILGQLAAGEQVELRGDPRGEWTPVTYQGKEGWVASAYVRFADLDAAAGGTATVNANVQVRRAATTMAPAIGTATVGEKVAITDTMEGLWAPVKWRGQSGWIYGSYLDFDAVVVAADDKADDSASSDSEKSAPEPETDRSASQQNSSSQVIKTMYTTDAVNVRTGPGTEHRSLAVLPKGRSVDVRGDASGSWTPVIYEGKDAWIHSDYLADEPVAETTTAYTTTRVNLRSGPSLDDSIVRVLETNTEIQLTGVAQGDWRQVNDSGSLRWISSLYISDKPIDLSSGPSEGSGQYGPEAPVNTSPTGGPLNTGYSQGLDEMRETTKGVVYAVRRAFPQITTMYGVRPDPFPDHPSGRAVDLMMPNGASDVDLGNALSSWLRANANALDIEYLIWRQHIWINGSSDWEAMEDRGGITANHYDHVHVTVNE